jgi:hypothetical protein
MTRSRAKLVLSAVVVAAFLGAASALASPSQLWRPIHASSLDVTSGHLFATGPTGLATTDDELRAVVEDNGVHAADARLGFRFLGPSAETKPLGSGLVRRQIGLKLRAADPCNLVYVMWRTFPDRVIEISVKRNPGETTSAECGDGGYTDVALIPEASGIHERHVLEADTQPLPDGSMALTVYADGAVADTLTLPATLVSGLDGPVGVRSDNGHYRFTLSVPR